MWRVPLKGSPPHTTPPNKAYVVGVVCEWSPKGTTLKKERKVFGDPLRGVPEHPKKERKTDLEMSEGVM